MGKGMLCTTAPPRPWVRPPFCDLPDDVQRLIAEHYLIRQKTRVRARWAPYIQVYMDDGSVLTVFRNRVVQLCSSDVLLWVYFRKRKVRGVYNVRTHRALPNVSLMWTRPVTTRRWRHPLFAGTLQVCTYRNGTHTVRRDV
jgi:hypothetical protein